VITDKDVCCILQIINLEVLESGVLDVVIINAKQIHHE
jgi:hypothetical protein